MVILGLMGAVNVGKTSVLQNFVRFVEEGKITEIEGGVECKIEKQDFKGEAEVSGVPDPEGEKEYSKTITPNKVVFVEAASKKSHTLFAPGGDKDRAVIRMGIITISRIARQIVGLFAVNRGLKEQFELYDLIRYMPKEVYICLNKYDLFEGSDADLDKMKKEISKYFKNRKIVVKGFFQTCAIDKEDAQEYNDNAARMILDIILNR